MQTYKEGMPCSLPSLRFQSPEAHTLQKKFTAGIQYCGLRSGYIPDKSHSRKESFTVTPSPKVQSTKAGHRSVRQIVTLYPQWRNRSRKKRYCSTPFLPVTQSRPQLLTIDWYSLPLGQVFPSGLPAEKSPSQTTQRIVLESPYPVKLSID